jgi:hypothetical protein
MLAGAGVWVLLFLAGSLPVLDHSYRNDRRLAALDRQAGTLTRWAAAGVWFEAAARRWEPSQAEQYDRLFPREKDREQLFLDLARVARSSGITPIDLVEVPSYEIEAAQDRSTGVDAPAETVEPDLQSLIEEMAPDLSRLPGSALFTHRIRARFGASYGELARLLAGLNIIPRAVTLNRLQATPGAQGIDVEMELDFYDQQSP